MTFDEIWTEIEKDRTPGSTGIIRRRILPEANCDLFLGIEKPSNMRVLLLRITGANAPDPASLPAARGFEVRILKLPDDPAGSTSMLLSQTGAAYRDIFTTLTVDVAGHLAMASDQNAIVSGFLTRLKRWQKFLERSGPDGLGELAQRGLFGELSFIQNHLLPVLGPTSISAWTGPLLTPQDFQLPGLAVETKVTIAREHQKMTIAGERQLEASPQLRVFVCHMSLSAQRDTGTSLNALVAELRGQLAATPVALDSFEDTLLAAGYLDVHAHRYDQPRYIRREHQFFEVRDDFPRIVGADLREGVGDVCYSISVAACAPYQLADAEFTSILGECRP